MRRPCPQEGKAKQVQELSFRLKFWASMDDEKSDAQMNGRSMTNVPQRLFCQVFD